jgi:hypothetical protein
MKKICLLFFAVALCLSSYAQYVDLGLPSGTKWKSSNETGGNNGYYTYGEAVKAFGNKLPTRQQIEELIDKCKWEWLKDKKAYKVTGPNGNFIILPALGSRDNGRDVVDMGKYGLYWSSYPDGSKGAWIIDFASDYFDTGWEERSSRLSVRLVQK